MSFISNAAHHKFILQCHGIISTSIESSKEVLNHHNSVRLSKDLIELQQLMDNYLELLAELPKITSKYYNLHRKIRINIRKVQQKKNQLDRRKLKQG